MIIKTARNDISSLNSKVILSKTVNNSPDQCSVPGDTPGSVVVSLACFASYFLFFLYNSPDSNCPLLAKYDSMIQQNVL